MSTQLKTHLVSALLLLLNSALVGAQTTQPAPYPGWHDWPGPWHMWGWGFWWIMPLLMIAFLIGCCVFFMMRMPPGHPGENRTGSAIRLLSERFARGEISKEEFEEKRTILVRGP
jgi:putative membrane protein